MKKIYFLLLTYMIVNSASAQYKFIVYFTDKANTPYFTSQPADFLTQRSIQRRQRQNIAVTNRDLPVTPAYVDSLRDYGVTVWYTSRWMNAAIVEADSTTYQQLLSLGFVNGGDKVKRIKYKPFEEVDTQPVSLQQNKTSTDVYDYGLGYTQATMIAANDAHNAGYKGQGMIIGVFDSGFRDANTHPALDSVFAKGNVLGTYDFVNKETSVYEDHNHGLSVFSTMAANWPTQLVGTAPEAKYYLFRTEDVGSEAWVEETNWLVAAERADSLGVDVINTSLGYTTFDDINQNYTYSDMDGRTAIISKAATMAARTGMLVNVSAGNEGGGSWYYISAPADADSVLAIGAVDNNQNLASFSSHGPSADGRVKPNLCAMGQSSAVAYVGNWVGTGSGTSYSGPIHCGMAACFWQANPNLTNMQVIDYLQKSGTTYSNPDNDCGYGIPSFTRAQQMTAQAREAAKQIKFGKYNPFENDKISIYTPGLNGKTIQVSVYDITGKEVEKEELNVSSDRTILNLKPERLPQGVYMFTVNTPAALETIKGVKF